MRHPSLSEGTCARSPALGSTESRRSSHRVPNEKAQRNPLPGILQLPLDSVEGYTATCRAAGWRKATGHAPSSAPRVPLESSGRPTLHFGRAVSPYQCRSLVPVLLARNVGHFFFSSDGTQLMVFPRLDT